MPPCSSHRGPADTDDDERTALQMAGKRCREKFDTRKS